MRLLLRLYPRPFRERYGDEVGLLLASSRKPVRDTLDVVRHALGERLELTVRGTPRFLGFTMALLGFAISARVVSRVTSEKMESTWGPLVRTPAAFMAHAVIFVCAIVIAFGAVRAGRTLANRLGYPPRTVAILAFLAQAAAIVVVTDLDMRRASMLILDLDTLKPTLLYFAAWLILMLALVSVVSRLHGRRATAAVLGGLVVLQVMAVLDVLFSGYSYLSQEPWLLTFWRSLAGVMLRLPGNGFVMLSAQTWLTTVYTCAALGYAVALGRRSVHAQTMPVVVSR